MLQPELSPLLVADIADAVGKAADLRHAYESIINELFRTVGTRAVILERSGPAWMLVAGSADGDFGRAAAEGLPFSGPRVVKVHGAGDSLATAVSLSMGDDRGVVLMLNGDWTGAQDVLSVWSLILTYALESVRAHDVTRRAQGLLVRGYSMVRRLSRVGNVDSVARRIVAHVAQMLDAERVSLALYRKADACLMIAATHGHALASVEHVRIKPGDWVIGHVYASKRSVFVRDVRLLSPAARTVDRYRTFSFAAVPMIAGSETVGVLTVTDKRDGSAFGRQDEIALRAIGVWAGIALATARVETEAARLAYAATVDSITGLLNRPYLDSRLHQEVERAKREGHSLSVLLADIDDFKTINDTWGHQVGDAVLQSVGAIIRSAVRVFDVCARYGGDEFAIVMPNSDGASAIACAERIRRRLIERRDAEDAKLPSLTISIGVAVIEPGDSASDLILRADQGMYQAKADGKNLVRAQASRPVGVPASASEPAKEPSRAVVMPSAGADTRTGDESKAGDLPYVLVADARQDRAAFCLESVSRFQLGLLIARDGSQATQLIERFGPPVLLIVDLALPVKDGFAVIEAVRRDQRRRPEIIAWAPSREMREYATARLSGLDVRVISDAAPRSTMRAVIERALEPPATAVAGESPESQAESEELRERMADLVNRARQLCGTAGVGVYMRSHGETTYHATFAWISDELMPHSPHHLPAAFERITQTGEAILSRDLGAAERDPSAIGDDDAVRGLAGVPIVSHGEVLGAICVFDIKPLQVDERSLAALKTLGQVTFDGARIVLPGAAPAPFRDRASDRDEAGGREDARILPHVVDWPPSMLERSGGEFAVARELARARREGHQLSVVLFDFTPASRTEPGADDATVVSVTETLLRTIRQSDLPIRWSGSELLVVLPGLADDQARTVAERVRAALHAGARHRVAISGGVAQLKADERFGDVVDRARQKVALAMGRGHNRVI